MQTEHYSKIQILPEHIIDQIKAGEVIERPSTLLKELLENSIDAGATKISVEIINNAMDLLVVKDNGKGMAKDDLELAFLRHATSKIEKFEDIYNLHSYGFRGEALASMASVSKITCVTNRENSPEATIKINGAQVESLNEDKMTHDNSKTEIFIKDLFYNTPARMKFVKSKTAEKNQLVKIINAFLLTHPQIEFSIKWDDKAKRIFKQTSHLKRIQDVTQKNFEKIEYLQLQQSYDDIKVNLFLSHTSSRGAQGKSQFIFINNRVVQNIQIHKIITNSASKIWGEGLSGHYCIFIDLPSDQIDVNVHPNKTVIKFFEAYKVHSLISAVIKSYSTQNITKIDRSNELQVDLIPKANSSFEDKNLQYKEANFTEDHNLDQYFKNLDRKEERNINIESSDTWNPIVSFEKIILYNFNERPYLLNKHNFLRYWIKCLDFKELTSLPLLISQPIKLERKNDKLIENLNSIGFEVDLINKSDLILRAIPEEFKNIDYKEFLVSILKSKKTSFNDAIIELNDLSSYVQDYFLTSTIKKIPLTTLIKEKVIKELTQEDLLNVF